MSEPTVFPGDLAEYSGRGEARRCEVLANTPKRVKVCLRDASGAVVVRHVKVEKLKRVGGGLLNAASE